jgi:prepilin-type N-terminal cleavage/methylation domain-containing protein
VELAMRRAFTLVEVTIVVLILGILAAVAVPKLLHGSAKTSDTIAHAHLAAIRAAIDLYHRDRSQLPGANGNEATFKADLALYLRKLPALPVGTARNDRVAMDNKLSPIKGDGSPTEGWRYYYNTGVFIINYKHATASDASVEYDDL